MKPSASEEGWQVRVIGPGRPWGTHRPRPADVRESLCAAMLARENLLEDADYHKIVPNRYIVELEEENYIRYFRPIQERILRQWRAKLLAHLTTANSRQGRQEYHLGGAIHIEVRPVSDLAANRVRILCRVQFGEAGEQQDQTGMKACLEVLSGDRRWTLRPGLMTVGRDESCDIHLDMPMVQEKRLISGKHAYLRHQDGQFLIYDGVPGGKPSTNGTYVNGRRVPQAGQLLQDGDTLILASLDPANPRLDTPGVAAFRFREDCP